MKKIFLLTVLGVSFNGISQKDFLRNYKAPDFTYRTFNVDLLGRGNGGDNSASALTGSSHNSIWNLDLGFYQRANTQKYQGWINANLDNSFRFRLQNSQASLKYSGRFNTSTLNRVFFSPKWFVGLHDNLDIQYSYEGVGINARFTSIAINPTFSIGKGRVEPVRYARNSMDIDFLLSKSGVLKTRLNESQLTEISNRIAVIQNKRFFDPRRARIYQLQALDSVMQEIGVPIDRNAVYFADLQDAYLYGRVNERLSGMRHEIGLAQGVSYINQNLDGLSISEGRWFTRGFYNFSFYLPQSYKTQHELQATIVGGANNNSWGTWLNTRYSFGFYPTTRTGMNIGVFANFNYLDGLAFNTDGFGWFAGLQYDAYYFISPRLRISAGVTIGTGDGYRSNGIRHIHKDLFNIDQGNFQYRYDFGLRYSIF